MEKRCPKCNHKIVAHQEKIASGPSILKPQFNDSLRESINKRNVNASNPISAQQKPMANELIRSEASMISFIISFFALLFQWIVFRHEFSSNPSSSILFELGSTIGMSIILPSLLSFTSAWVLNIIGFYENRKYITLASAVLYGAALITLPSWGFLAIPSLALQIIAYGNMKE